MEKKDPKTTEDFFKEEQKRLKEVVLVSAAQRYKKFKQSISPRMDLFAVDFKTAIPGNPRNWGPIQILLASDIYMPLPYEEIYRGLISIFSEDLDHFNLETTYSSQAPQEKTAELRNFIKINPGQALETSHLKLQLKTPQNSYVEITRYFADPEHLFPISEIWTATRLKS